MNERNGWFVTPEATLSGKGLSQFILFKFF